MSTPPNPPSSPSGPPTEPVGTPVPEPAQPLSLSKTPAPEPTPEPEPAQPLPLSLSKTPESVPTPTPKPEAGPESAPAPAPVPAPAPAPAAEPAPQPAAAPEAVPAAVPQPGPVPAAAPAAPAGAFAPPAPMPPPAAPGPAFGAPVPPTNPWGAHAGHGATPGNPWGAPAPTTNGLAVAALTIGIAAVVIGLIPFVFWAGFLLAVVGIGIGIGALVRASDGAGRKTMAVVGTVLAVLGLGASVGGLLLTGLIIKKTAAHRLDDDRNPPADLRHSMPPYPRTSPTPTPSPSQVPGMTTPLPFGETFTYPNGIKVSLSAPKKYVTKNKYSEVGNAVEMTLTITNGSSAAHNVIYAMPNVRDEKGMTAKLVFDGDVPKMIRGDILPGESASGVVAFEVPEGTERISADISPGIMLPNAKFSGSIG
ncbi:DUF4190 domain-containing protein [Streptomyces sp. NPDC097981]|uniref:DUF4190 domain-containing protein n=1 Tax=Streptomyces sp. NPDC097981 TaxID=3155428 RepID=UPI00331BF85F